MSDIREQHKFLIPSPTEIYLLVAAGWAGLCFALMINGDRLVRQIARMSRTAAELLMGTDLVTVLPFVMVAGMIGLAVAFSSFARSDKAFIFGLMIAFAFADSTWAAFHYLAFAVKYLAILYLGAFGLYFVYRNWNRITQTVHWLVIAYLIWMTVVVFYYGARLNGLWYIGTQFTLCVAFGIGWMNRVDDDKKLMDFNIVLAYAAIAMTCLNMLSPLVAPKVFDGGRYISQFGTATGFATTYVLFVIAIVWLFLAHPDKTIRRIAAVFSILGVGMILLSGTRNATAALACAIILLSFTFKSRIIIYAVGAGAFFGAVIYLIAGNTETATGLADRMGSLRNTRIELWQVYVQSVMERPLFGWGPSGQTGAFYGAQAQEYADKYTSRGFAPGVHNAILGQAVRFGIPGVMLFLGMFGYAFWRAKEIVLDKEIPQHYKRAFSLPLAILVTLFLEGAFEDNFATTRGTAVNVLFGTMVILVVMSAERIKLKVAQDKANGVTSGDVDADVDDAVEPDGTPKKLVRI